jgi:hypothetical protein
MNHTLFLKAALGLALTAGPAAAQAERYPGLFRELRAADLIVKVKLTDSRVAVTWKDEKTVAKRTATLDGIITAVYQGRAEVNQPIGVEADLTALERRQKKYGDFGSLFYWYQPIWRKGEVGVFLIKNGKALQATAFLSDTGLVPEYVKVSRLPDADATLGVLKLLCALAYDKRTAGWYPYTYPHVLLNDFAANYKYLPLGRPEFKRLLADRRQDTLKALREAQWFDFHLSVYLTALTEKDQRREALAVLLARYEANQKLIGKLEKEQKAAPGNQGEKGIAIDELSQARGWGRVLLVAMHMIQDPAWTRDIATTGGSILAPVRFWNRDWDHAEVLARVKATLQK